MYAGRILSKGFAKKRKGVLLELRARDRQGCGGLPLFTELPRACIPGNRASGIRLSRKLKRKEGILSEAVVCSRPY